MLKKLADEHWIWCWAAGLGLMVLLASIFSDFATTARFLSAHEFRLLPARMAEAILAVLVVLCTVSLVAPLQDGKWRPNQFVFLAIGAFARWRITIIHHLLNKALGI